MPGSDGRKMFIVSADKPAIIISVEIWGGVRRFRNWGSIMMMHRYACGAAMSIGVDAQGDVLLGSVASSPFVKDEKGPGGDEGKADKVVPVEWFFQVQHGKDGEDR
jgi:hypothetical protein